MGDKISGVWGLGNGKENGSHSLGFGASGMEEKMATTIEGLGFYGMEEKR